ncbi:MAG: thiol:disulfide interchange protein, partial [Ignavibacteriae bacterium]|nr:thiol:disulfide interchange protein [Ignavibacteriota bacterium]
MKNNRLFTIVIFLLLSQSFLYAQFGFPQEEILSMEAYSSFEKIYSEGEIKIAVKININENWHINSNNPKEDFLIPTELKIISDIPFEQGDIIYPEAEDIKLDFSDTPLSVFEKEIYLGTIIKVPKNIELGKKNIIVQLFYQGCNNSTCMAPNSISDTLEIEIVDRSSQTQEINGNVFKNVDLDYSTQKTIIEEDDSLSSQLEQSGLFLTLLIVFLGGLALNLTPCVYPLIPITIGFF